ncbi:Thiamin pyrophosphokinase [Suhomyces tanzawaensis NRRL Y-17324]|uniref:Thiamine pyrophosphokinase n=1 Tax=Suhomyces tanzawaensis NRRL Y-17324 TaxID=984487 RepID=A0A1E4SGI9_9ASCO|nr:Thiamin pyrophosphokinase [Suhomyces tanzawaensis NRRL Y-17324]ODV78618.1 Thiamin pyrophosphokinase [Suhomyces tanzawaensis NRRL Y-17324]
MGNEELVIERADLLEVTEPSAAEDVNWIKPFEFLRLQPRTALVILNQSIGAINLLKIWGNTELHVCADGGANQLYDYFQDPEARAQHIPQFIVGDFDSLRTDVKHYYSDRGAVVVEQQTQYSSDFMKAALVVRLYFLLDSVRQSLYDEIDTYNGLAEMAEKAQASNSEETTRIYYLGGIGGRFDQTVQSISQMYSMNESTPYIQQFFITNDDIIFLAKKGKNYVSYGNKNQFHTSTLPCCGLLPMGNRPVVLNSYGLKYDVENWHSLIGGKVSSSNSVAGISGFYIDTSDALVVNIEIEHGCL